MTETKNPDANKMPSKGMVILGTLIMAFLAVIAVSIAALMLASAIKLASSDYAAQAGVMVGFLLGGVWIARLLNKQ